MAADTTILSGDVSVWYLSNGRTKMMDWSGSATGTRTMNELYSAMQTLLDEASTMDDATAFNADTPTEYKTGIIDAGDNDPWYVTFNLMEHITGGSLYTSGWSRVTTSNTGIVIVPVTRATMTLNSSDIGDDGLNHATGLDTGTLLEIINDGSSTNAYLVIRPEDDTAANDWNETSGTINNTGSTRSATQAGAGNTGEMIWANIYSIGTIDPNVHLYVYQGEFNDSETATTPATDTSNRVYSVNSTSADYWANGHIDICVPINRWQRAQTDGAWDNVDDGYLRVFARKGGDLYASFEVSNSTTSGGRNPVPLQTSLDLNQGHGTRKVSTGTWTGTAVDLSVLTGGTNDGRAIFDVGNSTADSEIVYWPIAKATRGGEIQGFVNTEVLTDGAGFSATAGGSDSADGPADATWFTGTTPDLLLGYTQVQTCSNLDIDNDGTDEEYCIYIDCNSNPLSEVYQWMKYICQYTQGDTDMVEQAFSDDLSQANIYGEEYDGPMAYATYTAETGTVTEGDLMTQAGSDPWSGVLMYHDETNNTVVFRNCRGTLETTTNILQDVTPGSNYLTNPTAVGNFAASTSSPFGTYAGGTYFGARGVVIDSYDSGDENSFILTDIFGDTYQRPTSVLIEVTNVWGNAITLGDADLVTVYPLTGSGGDIDKDPADAVYAMNCDGGEAIGATTLAVDAIPVWAPSTGRVVLIDNSDANKEYVLRYSSYNATTDTYTLANIDVAALDSANGTYDELTETGAFGSAQRGDLVYNHDLAETSYIIEVDSANTITISPAFSADPTGDHIEVNCTPILVTSSDNAFNCIIHDYPTTSTASASIIYPGSQFYFRVKVRNTRETDLTNGPIKPFSSDGSTTGSQSTTQVVRTIDTVLS